MIMLLSQTSITPKAFLPPSFVIGETKSNPFVSISCRSPTFKPLPCTHSHSHFAIPSRGHRGRNLKLVPTFSVSSKSDSKPDPEPNSKPETKSSTRVSKNEDENPEEPRRVKRSNAAAVEDFVRDKHKQIFESIRKQKGEALKDTKNTMKEQKEEEGDDSDSSEDEDEDENEKKHAVEDNDPTWPVDTEVGWGVRASEYFEKHAIRNTVGEDGVEINWEDEMDDTWVDEINILEWERFVFHPSPLIVLVFERYKRAADNWKALKELEKAALVYWDAKDRLPPRTVKFDINIEKDLAYALRVKEGPQTLFLRGNQILYRETEVRSSDELVQMIAYFYFNARKPSWIDDRYLARSARRF